MVWFYVWAHNASALVTVECAIELAGFGVALTIFFGLYNSSSTFQMMMNNFLHNLIIHGVMMVYMDNIMVYMMTLDEHQKVVMEVLKILKKKKIVP